MLPLILYPSRVDQQVQNHSDLTVQNLLIAIPSEITFHKLSKAELTLFKQSKTSLK